MKDLVWYIHGRGGSADESEHYRPLFPGCEVLGLDYRAAAPREAAEEIFTAAEKLKGRYERITLVANSIGAYFSMCAGIGHLISKACFISPIVHMEKLITDMMQWANVTEAELKSKGVIHTAFGEDLSWDYLCHVREHPIDWTAPTQILYGSRDNLTPLETISDFAEKHNASLTVMNGGEHWFHTEEQMRFLDEWILGERQQYNGVSAT
jgi:pimeloyl-ACP methyl ester carboxylesterase